MRGFLVLASVLLTALSQKVVDQPYREIISSKFKFSADTRGPWPVLDFGNVRHLYSGRFANEPGVFVLTASSLYFMHNLTRPQLPEATVQPAFVQLDRQLGVAIGVNTTLVLHPLRHTLLAVATKDKDQSLLTSVTCESLVSCRAVSSSPISGSVVTLYAIAPEPHSPPGTALTLLVGGSAGLFRVAVDENNRLALPLVTMLTEDVLAVTYRPAFNGEWSALLAVSTSTKVYTRTTLDTNLAWDWEWASYRPEERGGVTDGPVSALSFDHSGRLYAVTEQAVNMLTLDGVWLRLGPLDGLPALNYTSVAIDAAPARQAMTGTGGVWFGSVSGLVYFDAVWAEACTTLLEPVHSWGDEAARNRVECAGYTSAFRRFGGERYTTKGPVLALAAVTPQDNAHALVVATSEGLAVLSLELWTLERKANSYGPALQRNDRYGLVSDCPLAKYGDITSCTPDHSDNDGLWTAILAVGEAYRFAVTRSKEDKAIAWRRFEVMKLLSTITGIRGHIARSFYRPDSLNQPPLDDKRFVNSSVLPGWRWKIDASSDEMVGHFFALPLIYDLVAETEAEKAEVRNHIDDIATYLVVNRFQLIDITGKPTLWARWDPTSVNADQSRSDTRGLNSLQISAFLHSAARITGKTAFSAALSYLAGHRYTTNMVNTKIQWPEDENYSDDELTFLPYHTLFLSGLPARESAWRQPATLSLWKTFKHVRAMKSSLWATIFLASLHSLGSPSAHDAESRIIMEEAAWSLRTWPVDLVKWRTINSDRYDVYTRKESDRTQRYNVQSVTLIPQNERRPGQWNHNQFEMDQPNEAFAASSASPYLCPYWMARYHGFITAPTSEL